MKLKCMAWLVMLAMFVLASCDSTNALMATASPTPPDMLSQMFEAQDRATNAGATAQRVAAQATTIAQATREYVVLKGQQTRVEDELRKAQTVFADNVNATATARTAAQTRSVNEETKTQVALSDNRTATARADNQTTTAQADNRTATARADDRTGTHVAQLNLQTREASSATATYMADIRTQTRISGSKTATHDAEEARTFAEKQNWERNTEAVRAIAAFIFGALLLIGLAVLIGWGVWKLVDALVFQMRSLRGKTGELIIVQRDRDGREWVHIPERSPGAFYQITPPETKPLQIEASVIDEETTKRDQAISLMLAASRSKGDADELLSELTEGEQIKIVDEPPAQLIAGDTAQLLDGDWKRLSDGSEAK